MKCKRLLAVFLISVMCATTIVACSINDKKKASTETWDDYYSSRVNPDDGVTTRLEAILGLVDTALTYGRNLEGAYYPSLFVDGVNVNTKEPIPWILNNEEYYYSNIYAQQGLMRILDGLTTLSGDPKYRDVAYEQYQFMFDNLVDQNGLLYAGTHVLVDVMTGKIYSTEHETNDLQIPWELMWAADPEGTQRYIEAYWNTHVYDMSSIRFDRHGYFNAEMKELWDTEYLNEDPYVEAEGKAVSFTCASNDLMEAAYFLAEKTGDERPRIWADRMLEKFIAAQDDNTGLMGAQIGIASDEQGGDRFKYMFRGTELEKYNETQWLDRDAVRATAGLGAQTLLSVYEKTADEKIYNYVADNMLGIAKYVYNQESHMFNTPIITDGYDLGGVVPVHDGYFGLEGTPVRDQESVMPHVLQSAIYTYALAEDKESVKEIWDMARSWAKNLGLGDIGSDLGAGDDVVNLETTSTSSYDAHVAVILYQYTEDMDFYNLACKIGDNIVEKFYRNGLFVAEGIANAKFSTEEAYAVFIVEAMSQGKFDELTDYAARNFAGIDLFYDGSGRIRDHELIYGPQKNPVTEVSVNSSQVTLYIGSDKTCVYPDTLGHWAEAQIRQLSSLGVVSAKADGNFYPDELITCDEAITLVKALCKLSDNSFVPGELAGMETQLITKEEFAAVLASALKAANPDQTYYVRNALYKFEDKKEISEWARDYVDIAYNYRLIADESEDLFDPTFEPKNNISRAQAADSLASLFRFMEKKGLEKLSVEITPDNANDDVVTWTSSNTNVVDVDAYGVLYPISCGEADITATVDGVTDTIPVNVVMVDTRLIKNVRFDGVLLDVFDPEKYQYDVLLPLGTESIEITAESFDGTNVIVNLPKTLPGTAELYVDKEGSPKYEIAIDPSHIDYVINENFDSMESGESLYKKYTKKYSWELNYFNEHHCLVVPKNNLISDADTNDKCIEIDYIEEESATDHSCMEIRFCFPKTKYLVGESAEDDNLIVCDFDIMVTGGDTENFAVSFGKAQWDQYEFFMNSSAHRLDFNEPDNELVTYPEERSQLVTNFKDGEFLNIKFVMNKRTQTADYYVDGVRVLKDVAPVKDTLTEIDGLMFYMHNGFTTTAKMYVDNLKIYDIAPNALEESFAR